MRTFLLETDNESFKTLNLDTDTLVAQLMKQPAASQRFDDADDLTAYIVMASVNNSSFFDIWGKVEASFDSPFEDVESLPDVSDWLMGYLLMNEKAYQALGRHIENEGELLPIWVGGNQMYLFNCLQFGLEDSSKCKKSDDYFYSEIGFDENDIENKLLFKSALLSGSKLFTTDKFKRLYEQAQLTGLTFNTNLCD